MRALAWLTLGAAGFLALVGCGPNCQSTCDQIYNACGIIKPGQTTQELVGRCNEECESALRESGELGDYNPNTRRSSAASIDIENEVQAAAWMDCVWFIAPDATPEQCADLDPSSGYCAPI
jgi:hypothetical protein